MAFIAFAKVAEIIIVMADNIFFGQQVERNVMKMAEEVEVKF